MDVSIFSWDRFDLPIKDLFLDLHRKDTSFGREIYKEHLRVWNGFVEFDNPEKNTFEAYESAFIKIYQDLKQGDFDWQRSPIERNENGFLLNGSHRLVASNSLEIVAALQVKQSWDRIFDYRYFEGKGLSDFYMDAAALQMARKNPDLRMIHIFPAAKGKRDELESVIQKFTKIAYHKEVKLNVNGALRYTMELYRGERWVGDWGNDFGGFRNKSEACFPNSDALSIYWVELKDLDQARILKEEIRDIFKIGNHSIHINDTAEETLRLSRATLNANSLHFLNYSNLLEDEHFERLLKLYEHHIEDDGLDAENYCVTMGGVLSIFGLRGTNDLDYLHTPSLAPLPCIGDIESHNAKDDRWFEDSIDEILYNPKNHFYFGNIKVVAPDLIYRVKMNRGKQKDGADLELLRGLLRNKKRADLVLKINFYLRLRIQRFQSIVNRCEKFILKEGITAVPAKFFNKLSGKLRSWF
jgi:hypothetical protein